MESIDLTLAHPLGNTSLFQSLVAGATRKFPGISITSKIPDVQISGTDSEKLQSALNFFKERGFKESPKD